MTTDYDARLVLEVVGRMELAFQEFTSRAVKATMGGDNRRFVIASSSCIATQMVARDVCQQWNLPIPGWAKPPVGKADPQ